MFCPNLAENTEKILCYLPTKIYKEIEGVRLSIRGFFELLSEVRLEALSHSSVVIGGQRYPLFGKVDHAELEETLIRITGGELFAVNEQIKRGYIALSGGVRVGICGRAAYDGDGIRGISEIGSLVFRFQTGRCDFADHLYSEWCSGEGGMLIASKPAAGKTTALRSLCQRIGTGRGAGAVVIVDERCEFDALDRFFGSVSILRGYRRAEGVEIALRTMSPEVIVVDEILTIEDAEALSMAVGAGVTVLASTHAGGCREALLRPGVRLLAERGAFTRVVLLGKAEGRFFIKEVEAC